MWTCPECRRDFAKTNQSHSCRVYPLENHFKGKEEVGKPLFDEFLRRIRVEIGPVKIDSPECCIHLVKGLTFAAVWVRKDKIKIDFRLAHEIKSGRFSNIARISANRYIFYMDILTANGIDAELMSWLGEAYALSD